MRLYLSCRADELSIAEDYPEDDSYVFEDVIIEDDDPEREDILEDIDTDTDTEEQQPEDVQRVNDSDDSSADFLSTTEQSEEIYNESSADDSGSAGTASGSSEGVAYDDSGILAVLSELSYNQRIICAFLALSSGINVGFLIFDKVFK